MTLDSVLYFLGSGNYLKILKLCSGIVNCQTPGWAPNSKNKASLAELNPDLLVRRPRAAEALPPSPK